MSTRVASNITLLQGDCKEIMARMEPESFNAIVTDPPYGLEFMGKKWDRLLPGKPAQDWHQQWAEAALRVLKPGGHLVAFGGTRTSHRLVCALEDAGFEIRDGLVWLHGQGFPKSRNLDGDWDGWGTALKPGNEHICLARKTFRGTVAENVSEHGTGALRIGACRIPLEEGVNLRAMQRQQVDNPVQVGGMRAGAPARDKYAPEGRWPANVLLSHSPDCEDACVPGCPVAEFDEQSGETGAFAPVRRGQDGKSHGIYGDYAEKGDDGKSFYGDTGGASRFFYCSKAPSSERWAYCKVCEKVFSLKLSERDEHKHRQERWLHTVIHPAQKPLRIMRWLVRLVTPPGGVVLDPFAGTGTTLCAARIERFACTGIEQDADYIRIAETRLAETEERAGLW